MKKTRPVHILHRDKVRKVVALGVAAAAKAVVMAAAMTEKEPMHNSWQTDQHWLVELLKGREHSLVQP
jgi:hypothetical protein